MAVAIRSLAQRTLTDHLNTVRDIAKYNSQMDTTTVVNHLVYDAYGKLTSETNPLVDSLFRSIRLQPGGEGKYTDVACLYCGDGSLNFLSRHILHGWGFIRILFGSCMNASSVQSCFMTSWV